MEGIARALEEAGRGQEVVLIGHELTEGTRRLLVAGTIDALIDQNPRVEAREAIDLLVPRRGPKGPWPGPCACMRSFGKTCLTRAVQGLPVALD